MTDDRTAPDESGDSDTEMRQRAVADAPSQTLGRVASPLNYESTTQRFYFWVPPGTLVEKTHLVVTRCVIAGRPITFYGVVEEVLRRSRQRGMDGEVDLYDGDLAYQPPFTSDGITYAETSILRIEPPILTPPLDRSDVQLAGQADARQAFGYDEMVDDDGTDWSLPIGLLRNGGTDLLGPALIDLRDLCGERAGHLNVTGQAGRGTKSSFLLVVVRMLVDRARAWDDGTRRREPFSVRPIVFNVKGEDLMFIDAPNRYLTPDRLSLWAEMASGSESGAPATGEPVYRPSPFENATFFAPCTLGNGGPNRGQARVRRPVAPDRQTQPYYWTLADVVRFGLWPYLFSDDAMTSEPLSALADYVVDLLSERCPAGTTYPLGVKLRTGTFQPSGDPCPQSFEELRDWARPAIRDTSHLLRDGGIHASGTCRALLSRLVGILDQEGRAIFDAGPGLGRPLDVLQDTQTGTIDPLVIDIATLPPDLRRFVVAAVLQQVKDRQTSSDRVRGQIYALVLDELGLYAPRGARDPITRLVEHVAAQLRSQGIILLGAQQQASRVSDTVFGNSEIKALGASSPVELESSTWNRLLSSNQKSRALMLRPDEKLVHANGQWMNVVVPFPAWAMKRSEATRAWLSGLSEAGTAGSPNGTALGSAGGTDSDGPAPAFTLNPPVE